MNFTRQFSPALQIPTRFLPIIDNLKVMFGDRLELLSVDDEWLNFRVIGRTESELLMQLQREAAALLGANAREFQVVTPLNARKAEGISIRWVGLAKHLDHISPGFWYC